MAARAHKLTPASLPQILFPLATWLYPKGRGKDELTLGRPARPSRGAQAAPRPDTVRIVEVEPTLPQL